MTTQRCYSLRAETTNRLFWIANTSGKSWQRFFGGSRKRPKLSLASGPTAFQAPQLRSFSDTAHTTSYAQSRLFFHAEKPSSYAALLCLENERDIHDRHGKTLEVWRNPSQGRASEISQKTACGQRGPFQCRKYSNFTL